jgi:hypothetical protein
MIDLADKEWIGNQCQAQIRRFMNGLAGQETTI